MKLPVGWIFMAKMTSPTTIGVDQRELVLCRDCKHCFTDGSNVKYNMCDLNHNLYQGDNWYCADGERR